MDASVREDYFQAVKLQDFTFWSFSYFFN